MIPADFTAYYDSERSTFWLQDDHGVWIKMNKDMLRDFMEVRFKLTRKDAFALKSFFVDCATKRNVIYAGPLAGHPCGPLQTHGRRILVTDSPTFLEPRPGPFPTFSAFLQNLLCDPVIDQRPYFYGWLKIAILALRAKRRAPGQCLVIAGPRDCGKSFLQNLLTPLLGGRAAKPYQHMAGETSFNRELFGAEHLMIEDVVASTDIRSRRAFGNKLKEFTVNELQTCHGKFLENINVFPFWRISITVNDEPENLMVLPPLDHSVADKFILLRASDAKIPTNIDRDTYHKTISDELPHFLHWLLNDFQLPADLWDRRFGMKHYHHPVLLAAINDMSPETQLQILIETYLFPQGVNEWTGTAEELRIALSNRDRDAVRQLLSWSNATGTYLGRLAERDPQHYITSRNKRIRAWTIKRLGNEPEAAAAAA